MIVAILLLWGVWCIPMILYIYWKRGDWYLFIFPPIVIMVISLFTSMISESVGVLTILGIHIILIISYIRRNN